METPLEKAVRIAFLAHKGQRDKAGEPYIFHVLRVTGAVQSPVEKIVALLHDVVEDSAWTLDALRYEGLFPPVVVEAVDALTRRKGEETYAEYIERVRGNELARAVKVADLQDNLEPARISALSPDQRTSLAARYLTAFARLSDV